MEDYEKLYKEAIHRASGFRTQECKDVAKYIFPELAESEDERIKRVIKQVLNESTTEKDECYLDNRVTQQEVFAWLESIKERVQPKQEWSEEDKDILFRTIDNLKFLRDDISKDPKYAVNIIDIEREITWLKSLRPQNRWKPSDEQMGALKHAFNDCSIAFADMKILATLYEQLKALHRYEQDT